MQQRPPAKKRKRKCQEALTYWEAVLNVGRAFASAVFSTPTPLSRKEPAQTG